MVHHIYPHGAVELIGTDETTFKVNGHRVKKYYDKEDPKEEIRATLALVKA